MMDKCNTCIKREREEGECNMNNKRLKEDILVNYGVRPSFKATRDITQGDIHNICDTLGCELEKCSSGGLLFHDGPDGYNCIRFDRINMDVHIVHKKGTILRTIIKTFIYKNPVSSNCKPFTFETFQKIYDIFEQNGFKINEKSKKSDFDKVPDHIIFK